jgi:hypothetical protein
MHQKTYSGNPFKNKIGHRDRSLWPQQNQRGESKQKATGPGAPAAEWFRKGQDTLKISNTRQEAR